MSSNRMDWKTPRALFAALDQIFQFDFDPCPVNPTFDGLTEGWRQSNFVNPPYGTAIRKWVEKGWKEAQFGKTVVMLLPSRTDTRYWHEYVMKAHQVWLIKGRLRFDDQPHPAPFPSAIIVFLGRNQNRKFPTFKSVDTLGNQLSLPRSSRRSRPHRI